MNLTKVTLVLRIDNEQTECAFCCVTIVPKGKDQNIRVGELVIGTHFRKTICSECWIESQSEKSVVVHSRVHPRANLGPCDNMKWRKMYGYA